jgi:hypothetical protein
MIPPFVLEFAPGLAKNLIPTSLTIASAVLEVCPVGDLPRKLDVHYYSKARWLQRRGNEFRHPNRGRWPENIAESLV